MNHAIKMISIPEELYKKLIENQKDKKNPISSREDDMDIFNKNRVLNHKHKLRQKIQQEADDTPQKVQLVAEVKHSSSPVDIQKIKKEEEQEELLKFEDNVPKLNPNLTTDISKSSNFNILLDDFADKIIDKHYIYGITKLGQVLSGEGKVVKYSNIRSIVEYLVDTDNFTKAPSGTKLVRDKIEANLDFKHLKDLYLKNKSTPIPNQSGTSSQKYGKKLYTLWT